MKGQPVSLAFVPISYTKRSQCRNRILATTNEPKKTWRESHFQQVYSHHQSNI